MKDAVIQLQLEILKNMFNILFRDSLQKQINSTHILALGLKIYLKSRLTFERTMYIYF